MAISKKLFIVPAILLLAACGQGQDQQTVSESTAQTSATAPAVEQSAAQPETMPPETTGGMHMNMDMGGMHDPSRMMGAMPPASGTIQPAVSKNGLFKANVTSELNPVVINQLHSWTLNLTTADGTPVEDAVITVNGTMPAHAHGMPTSPQVTANLGGGNYKIEGMQFQMGGDWEVTFNVSSGTMVDDVVFLLTLQ